MKNAKKICKKLVKNAQAVSPIIATLMLVLVAVGSAGAFYVWQSGWQGGIEDKVGGSGELQASLTIGGSSTVYEFSAIAAEYYQAANPNYKVSYQKGGSGAGVASVGMGAVDIGSASRFVKDTENSKYPDLNKDGNKDFGRDLVEHVVAWDAVVILCKGTIAGGLPGTPAVAAFLNDQTNAVYTADTAGTAGNSITMTIDVSAVTSGTGATVDVALAGTDITVTIVNDDTVGSEETVGEIGLVNALNLAASGPVAGTGADAGDGSIDVTITNAVDTLIDATGGTAATDATVLTPAASLAGGDDGVAGDEYDFADGVDKTELINAINDGTTWFDRSDESGTEEVFCNKLLGTSKDTVEEAVTALYINQGATEHFPSNQDLLAAFADETTAWTFTSFGMADADSTDYDILDYDDGEGPITPTKDTIKDQSYAGIRPIVYITVGEPTGDISQYIDFCMMPENNINICGLVDYVSIY